MRILYPDGSNDKSLTAFVYASLREAILEGHFEPGEKLDQDKIADELKVSRTPIREALKMLAVDGFIDIQSYRGAFIPLINLQETLNIYEIRWIIEPEIVRQATPYIPEDVLTLCDYVLEQACRPDMVENERHLLEMDEKFHSLIFQYCNNVILKEILENLNNRIVRVRTYALHYTLGTQGHCHVEHDAILSAIRARQAEQAAHLMEKHLKESAQRVCSKIGEGQNIQFPGGSGVLPMLTELP